PDSSSTCVDTGIPARVPVAPNPTSAREADLTPPVFSVSSVSSVVSLSALLRQTKKRGSLRAPNYKITKLPDYQISLHQLTSPSFRGKLAFEPAFHASPQAAGTKYVPATYVEVRVPP